MYQLHGSQRATCYKFKNCYSCPEKPSDYWWLYIKILSIDSRDYVNVLEIQKDKHGAISINNRESVNLNNYEFRNNRYIKITESEWNKGVKRILKSIGNVTKPCGIDLNVN